ncbi:4-dimethylallyltryptophan N-methyltransferase [Fusarium albosuccineum]|uniref:4-dimethylallyltryptophan N-methyltransferase n=1 Tax=Fusarium albosuccineum TaxID=1237068 RepID=A0A8H4LLK4_9HYPO|nr:4-dimethylallyltryptophan N-methyltransferase [Fusarium albosuccineum]
MTRHINHAQPSNLEQFCILLKNLWISAQDQFQVVRGDRLEAFVRAALKNSLTTGSTLDKKVFYLDHEWPRGSDQTRGEAKILEELAPKLAEQIKGWPKLLIVELGAGNSTKTEPLLDKLNSPDVHCSYWIVEINKRLLRKRVKELSKKYKHIKCREVYGTFEYGVAMAAHHKGKKVFISLGSTATNFPPEEAVKKVRMYSKIADLLVLGQQGPDGTVDHHAPYDDDTFTKSFIRSGLLTTGNRLLGDTTFNDEWEIDCEITYGPWTHTFRFNRRKATVFRGFLSVKYTEQEFLGICQEAGVPAPDVFSDHETAMIKIPDMMKLPMDIVCIRHGQSVSNVEGEKGYLDITSSSAEECLQFFKNIEAGKGGQISNGDWLMDGLTSEGMKQAREMAFSLCNVYCVTSSPCTRAFQTARAISTSFEWVDHQTGEAGKAGEPAIYIDKRLQEPTPWSQDFVPLLRKDGDRMWTSYLEVKGGRGSDAGQVVGETRVDYTNAIWTQDDAYEHLQTTEARMNALEHPETIEDARKRAKSFLEDLWIEAMKNCCRHIESGWEGTPKMVLVVHGGLMNILEEKFHCKYTRSRDGSWEWQSSTALDHGEVRVFNLCYGDKSIRLEEKSWDREYEELLGHLYRRFESDDRLQYRNTDGSLVDQERGYNDFHAREVDEAIRVLEDPESRKSIEYVQGWGGLKKAPRLPAKTEADP